MLSRMPWALKRFQQSGQMHFITFSCHRRLPLLRSPEARHTFEITLEEVRQWYGFYISAYVVMPEHVHLLVSEPERARLSVAIQMLKQNVARKLKALAVDGRFWLGRYHDHNIRTYSSFLEKLRYTHRNPVKRGLVARPEDWESSSFRHYATGIVGPVEIESDWTAKKRERLALHVALAK